MAIIGIKKILVGIFVLLGMCLLLSTTAAFEDSFQYHQSDLLNDTWHSYVLDTEIVIGAPKDVLVNINVTMWAAQTFKATATGYLKIVAPQVSTPDGGREIIVEVRNAVGDEPGNTIYGSYSVDEDNFVTADGTIQYLPYGYVPVTNGVTYAIVIRGNLATTENTWHDFHDSYADGNYSHSEDSGNTWTVENEDLDITEIFIGTEDYSETTIVSNIPAGYTYNKVVYTDGYTPHYGASLYGGDGVPSDYWSFVVRKSTNTNFQQTVFLGLYDENENLIKFVRVGDYIDYSSEDFLFEFTISGGHIYLTKNGVSQGSLGTCSESPAYIELFNFYRFDTWIDDISTYPMVGIGKDTYPADGADKWTHYLTISDISPVGEPDWEIDASYTLKTVGETPTYDASEYRMIVQNILTGEITANTLIKEAGNSSVKPCGIVKYNRSTIFGTDYGLYYFYTTKDGSMEGMDYLYWIPDNVSGSSYLNFVNDQYGIGEDVYADYYIDNYDSGCNYYLKVFDPYGAEAYSSSVSGDTGTETFEAETGWEEGLYQGMLYRECSDGIGIAYDVFTLSNTMQVQGHTYDAENESALANVNVSFVQGATYFNTTSNATGYYNLSGIPIDIEVDVNASISGYVHNDFSFTPLQAGLYTIDLYLLPNETNIAHVNTSVGGLVTRCPFNQAIFNATVMLWNTSSAWTRTNYTNSMGYYNFTDIPNGTTYKINASNQHCDTEIYDLSTNDGGYYYQYFCLDCWYNLTVAAKDASTHATLTTFDVILDETTSVTAAMIYANFTNVDYGIHKIEVSKFGYYTAIDYVYVYDDTAVTVYLSGSEVTPPGGAGVYYPLPHKVEFTVMSWWGHKYPGVLVNVTGYEISHPQSWLDILLGINNETEIYNTSMNGTTDSGGAISFMMVETIKYRMTFTNATEGIDEVWYKYPKDDHYIVMVSTTESPYLPGGNWYDCVNFTANWTAINDTHAYINFYYNDTCLETHSVTMYINNTDTNETYLWNFTNTSDCNVTNNQTIVDHTGGGSFFVGFYVVGHDTYGSFFTKYVIKFKYFLDVGLPQSACRMLSIALLFFMACFFGATSVNAGAVILNVPAWTFYFWGWLLIIDDATTILVLSLTTTIAIIAYMTYRSRRVLND